MLGSTVRWMRKDDAMLLPAEQRRRREGRSAACDVRGTCPVILVAYFLPSFKAAYCRCKLQSYPFPAEPKLPKSENPLTSDSVTTSPSLGTIVSSRREEETVGRTRKDKMASTHNIVECC